MGLAMEHASYARTGDSPRGCWYYLRYFFLFISLIQFLIILGLVLFMVYGNVHVTTESNLKATERRAESLFGQVVELSGLKSNLSKQLNLTTHARDSVMQMLLSARRDLDRINASFRQCQVDRNNYLRDLPYVAIIINSEKECQKQLQETNKTCSALLLKLDEKAKILELELAKEKAVCAKDKEGLALSKRAVDEELLGCRQALERLQQEQQLADERLRKVQAFCLPLDAAKFEADLRALWRDSIIPRTLESIGYHYLPGSELAAIRRTCDHMPSLMTSKVEELAQSLRRDIERTTRENADLQRQKLEAERSLRASQEAKEKAEKEAQAREAKAQAECARQTQLALEEKAVLLRERDNLAKELEARKREVEQLKMQVEVRIATLDSCLKAKTSIIPIKVVDPPQISPPDPAGLEDFKKRILESQRLPAANPAANPAAPSSG